MIRRIIFLFFLLFLIGCKQKGKVTKISYSWWGTDERRYYTVQGIEKFQELNPDINVFFSYAPWRNYTKLYQEVMDKGTESDVMQINYDWLFKYSPDGKGYYDLSQLDDIIEFYNFTTQDLSFGMIGDTLNAIPIAFNALVPVFDKKIFDDHNLPVPTTWNQLFYSASILKKEGIYPIGITDKHMFLFCIANLEQSSGHKAFLSDGSYNLNFDDVKHLLRFYKILITEKVVYPDTSHFGKDRFDDNKFAGVICWCSQSSIYANLMNEKGGKAILGDFIKSFDAVEPGWYVKPATMYAIKKNTRHPQEAARLVNFLLNSREMALLQKCEKGVPSSNKSLTFLMENRRFDNMQYEALMKIRYHKGALSRMVPAMEDQEVINNFTHFAKLYLDGIMNLEEASYALHQDLLGLK